MLKRTRKGERHAPPKRERERGKARNTEREKEEVVEFKG